MDPVKVKICGITRPEDAVLAAELGVDFIGLNFVGGPRKLDLARAGEILRVLPASVEVVALARVVPLVPPAEGYVAGDFLLGDFLGTQLLPRRIRTFQIYGATGGIIHTHGEHPGEAFEWWEVVGISCQQDVLDLSSKLAEQKAGRPARVVLDVKVGGQLGGTGQCFDWNWLAEARAQGRDVGLPSVMLAGGLKPENVAEAVRLARPWGVDVSSGVEVAGKPGVKDALKMRDFIRAARGH